MKDYFASISVFFLVIFLLIKLTLVEVKRVNSARKDLDDLRQQVTVMTASKENKESLLRIQMGGEDVQSFVNKNSASLAMMQQLNSLNLQINAASNALQIPIQEQRTSNRQLAGRANSDLRSIQAHEYSIAILCSFRDSLVWLGKMEDAFPFARTESLEFTPSGEVINLRATIIFPVIDLGQLTPTQ